VRVLASGDAHPSIVAGAESVWLRARAYSGAPEANTPAPDRFWVGGCQARATGPNN